MRDKVYSMSARQLKIIAIITMTIDHIGLYLLPMESIVTDVARVIGRIAFPLFAFFVAEGFLHTRNLFKYFLRLFLFALIVELGLLIYSHTVEETELFQANVIWVLCFGLVSLWLASQKHWAWKLLIPIILIGAEWLAIPYAAYGIALILVFGLTRKIQWWMLGLILLNCLFIDIPFYTFLGIENYAKYPWIQWGSLLGAGFLFFYNHQLGKESKWFFYLYYPLHLAVIFAISTILTT